jgi:enamine deaminase RidA (YjgF/YER057c/UK114 family)
MAAAVPPLPPGAPLARGAMSLGWPVGTASTKETAMAHEEINPWEWSKGFGFSQAVKLTEPRELLVCSGQTAMGPDGSLPASADMGEQVRATLGNVVAVLGPGA